MSAQLREAASVILLRRGTGDAPFEVFLLRRRKGASFMASAFVFPGGGADEGEEARVCAARELFEEAGILLAKQAQVLPFDEGSETETLASESGTAYTITGLRKRVLAGENATALLAAQGMAWWTDVLVPWAHWITPSHEPRRFSARFFVCECPAGQKPSFDAIETVDQIWVTPQEAIARAGELMLPPPQIRTMWELRDYRTVAEVLTAGHARGAEPHPIMPRVRTMVAGETSPTLLLPWDREYTDQGTGDGTPLTYTPLWAKGPSRFVKEDNAWKHIDAPPGPHG